MSLNLIKIAIILVICFFTLRLLNRDYRKGLTASIFFLIVMPRELFIQLGAGLPTLTGYRCIILVLVFYFLSIGKFPVKPHKMPILNLLFLVLLSKFCSLLIAFNFTAALSQLLVFAIEIILFYIILLRSIDTDETVDSIIKSVGLAIFVIALLGVIDKYTQFNPVDYISHSSLPRLSDRNAYTVYSTFSHPIHFGTALAMGWPISIYLFDKETSPIRKKFLGGTLLLIIAGLYFSMSRGPWLGFIGATILLILFRFPRIRVKVSLIVMLTALVLILRPGIYDTIFGLSSATMNPDSLEGGSFYYRFELFKKAYREISKSSARFVFGYGDGAVHSMDLRETVSYGLGRENRFWSWDSEFAQILMHGGFLGLILSLMLYISILFYMIRGIRLVAVEHRSTMVALTASISVLLFMMTNVQIFSPQLHFLMWTNFAIGVFFISKGRDMQMIQ